MSKYEEKITDNSLWYTATPTPLTLTLPFYITEAGHFRAEADYKVERDEHDSYLLLYTIKGSGTVVSDKVSLAALPHNAVMINCHNYHKYFSNNEEWEFIWIHLKGSAVAAMFDVLYPNAVNIISVKDFLSFEQQLSELICNVTKNNVLSSISTSSQIHDVLNTLVIYTIENEQKSQKRQHSDDINVVIDFIQNNYSDSISIDDMIQNIHISKYHFIRLFHRIMGTTPYNYLTNYRINKSKLLLRTTNKSIAEISEECGFLDTSNFISQFKKNTNQKPTDYRRDFT